MNADPTHFVPIEEIMDVLGLPKRAVFNDITAGRIPGEFRIVGRKYQTRKPRVLRSKWNEYLAGEWQPTPARKPVGIHSIDKAS